MKAEIESEEMKQKFGATYGSYVKLRRLQILVRRSKAPRYRKEAMKVADEIIETDPTGRFAAAAGYLKGDLLASCLTEKSEKKAVREAKEHLEKFVKKQPDGLYRGEALMLLGKISLGIEWNVKDAEKYYTAALAYFRRSREKCDALSLYAPVSKDLKSQTAPKQKPTSLNQWKRIVYHDEDPLKLYNTADAPAWYIDNQEKECVFACGFLAFAANDYEAAKSYWTRVEALSPDDRLIDSRLPTTIYKRLMKACRLQVIMFGPEEKTGLKDADMRLKVLYAEYLVLLEKLPESVSRFRQLMEQSDRQRRKRFAWRGWHIPTLCGSKTRRIRFHCRITLRSLKIRNCMELPFMDGPCWKMVSCSCP